MAAVRSCVVGPGVSGEMGVRGEHKRDRVWVAEAPADALWQGRLLRSQRRDERGIVEGVFDEW
jgi:hypothetical protein